MRVLVVGTSHSASSCQRTPAEKVKHIGAGRWQDLIAEHYNVEVVTIARSGVRPEGQIDALYSYINCNPNERFDVAIIEGRCMENSIAVPMPFTKRGGDLNNPQIHESWLDGNRDIAPYVDRTRPAYSGDIEKDYPNYAGWFVDYCMSMPHIISNWSNNLALCKLAEKICNKVVWFSFSQTSTDQYIELRDKIGWDWLKDYALFECTEQNDNKFVTGSFPHLLFKADPDFEWHCYCKHLNELGYTYLFNDCLKPRLNELKIFEKKVDNQ